MEKTIEQTKIALDWAESNLKKKAIISNCFGELAYRLDDVDMVERARELHDQACIKFLES